MKIILAIAFALIGAEAAKIEGIPMSSLHSGNHWRKPWPVGAIDDGTNDEFHVIIHGKPKVVDPPIRYHNKMRQWTPNTWPYAHAIDDGTDDTEVLDIQLMSENMEQRYSQYI